METVCENANFCSGETAWREKNVRGEKKWEYKKTERKLWF